MVELTAEQRKNIRTALRVAKKRGASPKEQKALVEAMGVESTYRDLNYGDRDSLGILQQRNNGAWGAAKEDVATDVGQFLDVAKAKNASGKYGSAGSLAQAVQGSGFPDRYQQRSGEAEAILARYGSDAPQALVRAPGAPAQTVTNTTPGTDNSALRRQLVGQFLAQGGVRNSSAVLGLAAGYGQAADVPGTTTTQRVKAPSQGSTSTRPSPSPQGRGGSKVLELIYNDGGKGYGIKDGQTVDGAGTFSAVWAGHANHVHVAAGPKTVVALGKYAQRLGLHVGENSHFGGVNPGAHVEGSYHVKDEAIDVSAPLTPAGRALMKKYAKAVAAYNRTHRLPK